MKILNISLMLVNLHAVHDCDEVDEDAELIFGKPLEVICGV